MEMESQLLKVALSLGFPAWALVVWFSAIKITGMIRTVAEQLQQTHLDTEKRLVLLEDTARRLERLAETQDSRLRELERIVK